LAEQCAWWRDVSGVAVSTATMSRALTRLGQTRKKSRCGPANGTRPPARLGATR
jgi:hypothetical protein